MYPPTEGLSLSQKGELWDAVFRYHSGVDPEINDPMVCMAFSFFRQSFERDAERYEEIKEKRRIAGSLGGQAKASNDKQMLANATFAKQSQANLAVNVNDNDNVIINTPLPPSSCEEGEERVPAESPVVEEKQGKPKRKASAATGYSAEFEAAWSAYPRKVGKGAAWKAWQKCEIPADICDRIKWRKLDDDWQKDGGRFIPHMATWLNRAGWEDEGCKIVHAEPQDTPAQIARRAEIMAEYEPLIQHYKATGNWQRRYEIEHMRDDQLSDEGLL